MEKPEEKISIAYDQNDKQGSELYEEYEQTKDTKLIKRSAAFFRKSSNPEGRKIADFLMGFYWFAKGKELQTQC